jgi:error-prone DNA polymerase
MLTSGLHEIVLLERRCLEVYCTAHPLAALREMMKKHGVVTRRELKDMKAGTSVVVSGLVIFFHTPPTRSGRRIIFATLEDETGLLDLVLLPDVQEKWARLIYTGEVLTVCGRLERQGKHGVSISITVRSILPAMSGSYARLAQKSMRYRGKLPALP